MEPVPFREAIEWAKARGVVLPEVYYGALQGLARAMAFSVSGLSSLDQLQAILDSLAEATERGESFNTWKKRVRDGEIPLTLPRHRLENIYRTNIQGHYARGRCEQMARANDARPWRLYDAVNDSRTRPSHAAMDGFVARHDDPIWRTWTPPCGYQCRCRVIALSDRQVEQYRQADAKRQQDPDLANARRIAITGGPDTGWDYSVCEEPTRGIEDAIQRRKAGCGGEQFAARSGTRVACKGSVRDWLDEQVRQLQNADDAEAQAIQALGDSTYRRLVERVRVPIQRTGLSEAQGAILAAYTDRELDAWPLMNRLARERGTEDALSGYTDDELIRAGILIAIMDAALARLPSLSGVFYRGVDTLNMAPPLRSRYLAAHANPGATVEYAGYTSIMAVADMAYPGDVQIEFQIDGAKDIGPFSVGSEPELLLPRRYRLRVSGARRVNKGSDVAEYIMEIKDAKQAGDVPRRRVFTVDDREDTERRLQAMIDARAAWRAAGCPMTDEQRRRSEEHFERSSVELGGPIPARFKNLHHLDEGRRG
jgi:SPP1 gp7 family putative phage head morphogenesis protein